MTSKIQDKSTFHHVSQGARAFDVFEVPGLDASGEPVNVGLRIMGAFELADVIARARDFAASHGSKPKTGDPLYELARKAGTLAFVAVKADSPQQAPAPYFPGGAEQILAEQDEDTIAFLYGIWEKHAAANAPLQLRHDGSEALERLFAVLGEEGKVAAFLFAMASNDAADLLAFYGQPVSELTLDQLTLFYTLRAKAREFEEQARSRRNHDGLTIDG